MKKLILLLVSVLLFGLSPTKKIVFDNYISKVVFNKNYLVVGFENGEIDIKKFNSLKNIYKIKLPKIHDFMGDLISMPIYSLDIEKNKILILAGGEDSSREIFIFDIISKKLDHILTSNDTFMRASFINGEIFLAFLSDEVGLLDIKTKKLKYRKQIGNYVFSTYSLSLDKRLVVIGDESGSLKVVDTKTGKKLETINGFNKDQTLSLDLKKNYVINGSSDKRVGIYDIKTKKTILELEAKFLPYGASLSFDDKKFAIQYDEKNDIMVYNIHKQKIATLKGHTMALNGIKFINNNRILSYSPAEILIWDLK